MKTKIGLSVILLVFILSSVVLGETKKEYYPNGQLKSVVDINNNGKPNGIVKAYGENGKLEGEANYKDGKREGIRKEYDENGMLEIEENHKNGKRDGIAKVYYKNGKLQFEWNWKDDKQEGIMKEYDENGQLKGKGE